MVAAAAGFLTNPVHAACELASGKTTAALVELYTSEGCSSCPPADRQMRHLEEALDAGAQAVPLALHVPYWDYIGWKDRFARPAFAGWALIRASACSKAWLPQPRKSRPCSITCGV